MDIGAGIENAAGVVSKLREPCAEDALKSDCVRSVGWLVCWSFGWLVGWLAQDAGLLASSNAVD